MSDYDLDELNTAFSAFRSSVAPDVKPAGVMAAKHTAKRRQTVRAVSLAIAAAVLVIVPVTAYASLGLKQAQPPAVSNSPDPELTPSTAPSTVELPPSAPPSAPASNAPAGTGSGDNPNLGYRAVWAGPQLDGLQVRLPRGGLPVKVPFGVWVGSKNGSKIPSATNVKLTMDLSQITSVAEIVSVGGPCSVSGSTVSCDFGTVAAGNHLHTLQLKAKAGAPQNQYKQVRVAATGNEKSWTTKDSYGTVGVYTYDEMADISESTSGISGRVGNTVTVTSTVRNNGPSTYPTLTYNTSSVPAGLEIVGVEGCEEQSFTASTLSCRVASDFAPGQSRTWRIHVKIVSCNADFKWGIALEAHVQVLLGDPIMYDESLSASTKSISGC